MADRQPGALRRLLQRRAALLAALRSFLDGRGYVETETPILIRAPAPERHIEAIPAAGGRYLAASPELQMKRLVAGGSGPVYQITRSFRAGEKGERHNPEFTLLEWYRPGANYIDLMDECEAMARAAAAALARLDPHPRATRLRRRRSRASTRNDATQPVGVAARRHISGSAAPDLDRPFDRLTVADAFERFAGWRPAGSEFDELRFFRDLVERIEPALPADRGVFLYRYPASQASLARLAPDDPSVAERFEMYVAGVEVANAFTELADAAEQRKRFEAELAAIAAAGRVPYPVDEAFLGCLDRIGLCAGAALGVDRLLMALTGARRLADVVPFTWDDV